MLWGHLTEDTELRPLIMADAAALLALIEANRAHLRHWLRWIDGNTCIADTEAFIENRLEQHADGLGLHAAIWHHGALAGLIGMLPIHWPNRTVEIGYWLGAAFQGKGLMTQACRTLVAHSFDTLGLHRIEIRAATGNTRSRAIPERLGFTQEGIQRQAEWLYDHWLDMAVYSLLQEEWIAGAPDAGERSSMPLTR